MPVQRMFRICSQRYWSRLLATGCNHVQSCKVEEGFAPEHGKDKISDELLSKVINEDLLDSEFLCLCSGGL